MDANELIRRLQVVLSTKVNTGKLTLNLRDGCVESVETYVYARIKRKAIDEPASVSAH